MAQAGVPSGPCFTMDDISRDEHVHAHNMMVELPSGTERPVLMPGNPIKMSRTAEGPLHIYPSPGQDTQRILSRLLGLQQDEIDGLGENGAFGPQ